MKNSQVAPFTIVLKVDGFRIEAAGPIVHGRQSVDLSPAEWGHVAVGETVVPYSQGVESYTTARYAIVERDGREIAACANVEILKREWMGTWGGSSTENVFAVIDGRPAQQVDGDCVWIPVATPPPEGRAFSACRLPVAAIVEFQHTDMPPAGWVWDPEERVLSRSLP